MSIDEELHRAVRVGRLDDIAAALAAGADPNVRDQHGMPALLLAASWGMFETVELLAAHGATLYLQNGRGETPLHAAACNAQTRVVKLLLQLGANPNSRNHDGETPLHDATLGDYAQRPAIVSLLLDHGADINAARAADGLTPLEFAKQHSSAAVVELLHARSPRQ